MILYAFWFAHLLLFRGEALACRIGLPVVVLNTHLFDFTPGWIYVLGVGVAAAWCWQRVQS